MKADLFGKIIIHANRSSADRKSIMIFLLPEHVPLSREQLPRARLLPASGLPSLSVLSDLRSCWCVYVCIYVIIGYVREIGIKWLVIFVSVITGKEGCLFVFF